MGSWWRSWWCEKRCIALRSQEPAVILKRMEVDNTMSTLHRTKRKPLETKKLPPLEPGDNLDQKTFHARYEAMPDGTRAELIEGVVYMPSPLKNPHGRGHSRVMHWLVSYQATTPGT